MDLIAHLEKIIQPTLKQRDLELVQLKFSGQVRLLLQVMIERIDRAAVTMEDCVKASRQISALLDIEDPISKSYRLEVTSPGLDRPLLKIEDFQRFVGTEIKMKTHDIFKGRKNFLGLLKKADNMSIIMNDQKNSEEDLEFKYEEIYTAHLVPVF